MRSNTLIARQGLVPLLLVVLVAVLLAHFAGLFASLWAWAALPVILVLFRDPERTIASSPLSVLSPADGTVVSVGAVRDPYLERDSMRVRISMNPFGTYTTRSPVEGKVLEPPKHDADKRNPHGVWLQTDEGDDIVLVMNKGRLLTKPQCYIRFGDRIGQGRRCGFVHLGGRIDVYLPVNSHPSVAAGSRVRAGSDVIARILRA